MSAYDILSPINIFEPFVVDFPAIVSVDGPNNGNYVTDEGLVFVFVFSEPVTLIGDVPTMGLTIHLDSGDVIANYQSGDGTDTLTFSYPVQALDLDEDGITCASEITVTGGSLVSVDSGNDAVLEFTPPNLSHVTVNSTIPPNVGGMGSIWMYLL